MKKSLYLKIVTLSLIFTLVLFNLVSCASKRVTVPGEEEIIIDNIYVEYSNIGDTYYNLEKYSDAIKYYKMAMSNRKLYWSCYYKLAKCYALTNDWANALPMYKKLLKRDPDNNSLKASLAYIYSMRNEYEDAKSIYKELLQIDSNNEKYMENYLAVLLVDKKSYEDNTDVINELLESFKENYKDNKNIERFETSIKGYLPEETKEDSEENETEEAVTEESVTEDKTEEKK